MSFWRRPPVLAAFSHWDPLTGRWNVCVRTDLSSQSGSSVSGSLARGLLEQLGPDPRSRKARDLGHPAPHKPIVELRARFDKRLCPE
jgi:hypothetical protein